MAKSKQTKEINNFETTLAELNQIVEQMEKGDLSLEESLQKFEKGVKLARECQVELRAAEQKIQILTQHNGQTDLVDFSTEVASER